MSVGLFCDIPRARLDTFEKDTEEIEFNEYEDVCCDNDEDAFSMATAGNVEGLCKCLTESPSDINRRSPAGMTPLHCACWMGHSDCVCLLIEMGADTNEQDNDGDTALNWACAHGHLDCVQELTRIRGVTKIYIKNKDGMSPVHWAVRNNHKHVILYLLQTFGESILSFKNNALDTPLHLAGRNKNNEIFEFLVCHGANPRAKNSKGEVPSDPFHSLPFGYQSLGIESSYNSFDETALPIISYSEDAFSLAKMADVESLRNYLIKRPKEINYRSPMGMTPLHGACWVGHVDSVRLLLSLGANVDAEDIDGDTPLNWAASHGHLSCVKEMIETGGAKINTKNKEGNSPVHWAALRGHQGVIKYLLDKFGESILYFKNCEGKSPFDMAVTSGYADLCKLLSQNSMDSVDSSSLASRLGEKIVKITKFDLDNEKDHIQALESVHTFTNCSSADANSGYGSTTPLSDDGSHSTFFGKMYNCLLSTGISLMK